MVPASPEMAGLPVARGSGLLSPATSCLLASQAGGAAEPEDGSVTVPQRSCSRPCAHRHGADGLRRMRRPGLAVRPSFGVGEQQRSGKGARALSRRQTHAGGQQAGAAGQNSEEPYLAMKDRALTRPRVVWISSASSVAYGCRRDSAVSRPTPGRSLEPVCLASRGSTLA